MHIICAKSIPYDGKENAGEETEFEEAYCFSSVIIANNNKDYIRSFEEANQNVSCKYGIVQARNNSKDQEFC